LIGIAAFILGVIGFSQFVRLHPDVDAGPLDIVYYSLQLFVLGAEPLDTGGPFPPALELARFAAPAVTIYAVVEASRLLLAAELRRLRIRRVRQHVVICGDNPVAEALIARMRRAGRTVIVVRDGFSDADQPRRPPFFTVVGDPRKSEVLRVAGVGRAAAIYACTQDSAANTTIASAAARHRQNRAIAVHARVDDPDLCLALQARHLALPQPPGLLIDFFNVDELAARQLFLREPVLPTANGPPTFLIVGATTFGLAVAVEAARSWRLRNGDERAPLRIILADQHADEAVRGISQQYPFLTETCRIRARDADERLDPVPDRTFICYDDEERALKAALTTDRLWRGGPQSVLVRLSRLVSLQDAFHPGRKGDRLLDGVDGTLRLFGVVDAACQQLLDGDDLVERLARAIHEHYVIARTSRDPSPSPSTAVWQELPEGLRQTNRAQAADIGRKLHVVGCVLAPRTRDGHGSELGDDDVERLAELEHQRWLEEHLEDGWRPGDVHDPASRTHPHLVSWERLPDEARNRCRDAIRDLDPILAYAGLHIIRLK
jgi:voltage-gated potassium channel Kch